MSSQRWRGCRLGLAQMRIEPGEPARNLERALGWCERARSVGAEVVVFPEVLDLGWTHPGARREAGGIPEGNAFRRLQEGARRHGVWVCAGLAERATEHVYNSAVLLDPEGALRLRHRKVHEIPFARSLYAVGDRLGVAETPFGRVGLMICADAFIPGQVLSRALGAMGARLILSPCAWAVPPEHDPAREPYGQLWLDHYQPVAREFGLWIAGCSNVGPVVAGEWSGWRCIGCSLVVGPGGEVAARGPYGESAEELILVDVPAGS